MQCDFVVQKLWSFKYTKLVLKIEQIYLCFKNSIFLKFKYYLFKL